MEIRLAPRVNIKTSGKTEIDEKLKQHIHLVKGNVLKLKLMT